MEGVFLKLFKTWDYFEGNPQILMEATHFGCFLLANADPLPCGMTCSPAIGEADLAEVRAQRVGPVHVTPEQHDDGDRPKRFECRVAEPNQRHPCRPPGTRGKIHVDP